MRSFEIVQLTNVLKNSQKKKQKRHVKRKKCKVKSKLEVDNKNSLDSLVKASLFRFLNEKLYTCSSQEAQTLFSEDPESFNIYHLGYKQQLSEWPNDPLDWVKEVIIQNSPKTTPYKVADLGCGDARLSGSLSKKFEVFSFDFVAVNKNVTVCDMAHTPLNDNQVDFAVFCLSLMGVNCRDFIYEANRILKLNGLLIIVDIASRFGGKFKSFLKKIKRYGFSCEFSETTDDTYFVRTYLRKISECKLKPLENFPKLLLNPCTYKKR